MVEEGEDIWKEEFSILKHVKGVDACNRYSPII
jgi:hypothetical protein